jgi:hypothetical protein
MLTCCLCLSAGQPLEIWPDVHVHNPELPAFVARVAGGGGFISWVADDQTWEFVGRPMPVAATFIWVGQFQPHGPLRMVVSSMAYIWVPAAVA